MKDLINLLKTDSKEKFLEYLEERSYEENLNLLTMYYIGRGDCDEEFNKKKTPFEIFSVMKNDLKFIFGSNESVIIQISEKYETLNKYLERASTLFKFKI